MTNTTTNSFGGPWTESKLEILKRYLDAYTTVLKKTPFALVYCDAFAGTGTVDLNPPGAAQRLAQSLLKLSEEDQAAVLAAHVIKGSARVALEVTDRPFDRFIFIERDPTFAQELGELKQEFTNRDIQIERSDANLYLQQWCESQNQQFGVPWRNQRAVVFLDPFATEVDWQTVESIAATQSVDLWILFPISALTRLLPSEREPDESYAHNLDRVYGGPEWRRLYQTKIVRTLIGSEHTQMVRDEQRAIVEVYLDKLRTVFPAVAPSPKWFYNSRNSPLFAFMFVSANQGKGGKIALRIANHLLNRW